VEKEIKNYEELKLNLELSFKAFTNEQKKFEESKNLFALEREQRLKSFRELEVKKTKMSSELTEESKKLTEINKLRQDLIKDKEVIIAKEEDYKQRMITFSSNLTKLESDRKIFDISKSDLTLKITGFVANKKELESKALELETLKVSIEEDKKLTALEQQKNNQENIK